MWTGDCMIFPHKRPWRLLPRDGHPRVALEWCSQILIRALNNPAVYAAVFSLLTLLAVVFDFHVEVTLK